MLSVILLIFVIGLIWMLYRIKESPAEDVPEVVPEVKQTKIMDLTKGYDVSNIPFIGETVYDGTTQLTKEVFQIPFYYKFGIIIITAEVDSYSCPISGVSFSNINILWGKLNQSPERTHSSFYVGLFTDIVRNVNFTITSNIRASDRQYRVQIYTA